MWSPPDTVNAPAANPPSLRLLVAEDNGLARFLLTSMLERAGHAVVAVENGARAVEVCGTLAPFDLALLDLQMPVMDGRQAARRLRALPPGYRPRAILAISADTAEPGGPDSTAGADFDAHLAKPLTYERLLPVIAELLAGSGEP